ncbi:MAG: 4a-hydroxytetrahydrobiopterin dehydratase [Burkholderiaceae bacterium]
MKTVFSKDHLLASHCTPLEGSSAMSQDEIDAQIGVTPQWQLANGAIERTYEFPNYYETLAFVNALAFIVHQEDHHPDLLVSYNRCIVRFNTHSVGGVSVNDFICAVKADALYAGAV